MKVTRAEEPQLFEDINEILVDVITIEHLKYGEELVKTIVEFKAEYMNDFYSEVKDYPKYIGLWETNTHKSLDGDFREKDIHTFTRVKQVKEEVTKIVTSYVPI